MNVAREHSNAKTENKQSIRAYAKIAGRDWTYYVKTLHVNIGRPPDREQKLDEQSSPVTIAARALPEIHIDLGPSKFVSRLHAEIAFDSEETGAWVIRVNGRNGVRVNNVMLKRGSESVLNCGDIIEIANTQMIFITPDKPPNIHPAFIERAQRLANGEPAWDYARHGHPAHHHLKQSSAPTPQRSVRRQVTPPPRTPEAPGSRPGSKQSPLYNRGMMMESTEEIDYSHDSAKDLKPPYSYATMIAQAIFSSEEEMLTLSNIYRWIMDKYAFYRHAQTGWQNSIRHNLSLNKAFQKVPRRTDEPGKGMKWRIAPEHRQEYLKKYLRKTNSSAPSSPAARGSPTSSRKTTNGRAAGSSLAPKTSSPQAASTTATATSPTYNSFSVAPVEAYTPERGSRAGPSGAERSENHAENNTNNNNDQTPLPTRTQQQDSGAQNRAYGLSDNAAGSPPVLSSSYYDEGQSSMITPAPQRQQPRLPPPSTAQIPSKFMPMSSPAQFWKFADIGSTPARLVPDMSPLKGDGLMPSSSPPPPNLGSPSKSNQSMPQIKREDLDGENSDRRDLDEDGEEEGFDLARYAEVAIFLSSHATNVSIRGFQPIGSYHRQLSNAARASATS